MCADALIAQVIADPRKDLLNLSRGDGEDQVGALDAVAQAVILYVLLDHERDRKDALLLCLSQSMFCISAFFTLPMRAK